MFNSILKDIKKPYNRYVFFIKRIVFKFAFYNLSLFILYYILMVKTKNIYMCLNIVVFNFMV